MKLLKELCQSIGVPGREQNIIDIMTRELKPLCDEVKVDGMGNVIGIKKSKKKNPLRVVIAGHMDEIGFVVKHIDKNGFIRFIPRGGHVPRVLISQRVRIVGKKEISGVVEAAPAFLNHEDFKKVPDFKDMFIDTGLPEKELKKIVEVGDVITMDGAWVENKDTLVSKAFDNRVGCYMVIEAMRKLKSKNLNVEVVAVGTTQEEVGIRGAFVIANDYRPDMGIALDVTAAFDTPGVADPEQVSKLGDGVAIKINDSSSISNHGMVEFLKKIAKASKIKHQMEILPFGGTDAAALQRSGAGPVATLSIPTRYVHSPNETIHKKDLQAGIDLLAKFLEQADKCKLEF